MMTNIPAPWCQAIADELHRIAYDLGKVVNAQGDLPEPSYVQLHIQPSGDKMQQLAAIADLGNAIAGQPGRPIEMHDGSYHYNVDAQRGPVIFKAYASIDTPTALRLIAEDEQAQKDAEIERLRARVAELEADRTGLAYSRADDGADDPTPVSGARVPMHNGGMTDEGLIDETPEIRPLDTERLGVPGMVTCSYCLDRVMDVDWLAHARTHDPLYGALVDETERPECAAWCADGPGGLCAKDLGHDGEHGDETS